MSDPENRQLRDVGPMGISVQSSQAWKARGRALISGYVDSYTLLNFGVYASFMSGNTT